MPINTDLNVDPYFDDFDLTKQYYKVLFKPSYAVQARELTQLQSMLQNQVEQFGDNIFKQGSIIKGCNFYELNDLSYVKLADKLNFDISDYVGFTDTETILGETYDRENTFELVGDVSGVSASIIGATVGFETRNPDLNTFYINYTTTSAGNKVFQSGELLSIYKVSTVIVGSSINRTRTLVDTINVTSFSSAAGSSFGIRSAPGIIFQKGHFLYVDEQLLIVSKYTNIPDNVSVGYLVEESLVNSFQDASLLDNANGSSNQNAPGADRLKLDPVLTALSTDVADSDTTFFTLIRYSNGNAVNVRNVSQYNALGEEMARRTYEESGDYIVKEFKTKVIRRNDALKASVGSGLAYIKGYRVESLAEILLNIDDIANTSFDERTNQAVSFNYGGYLDLVDTPNSGTVVIDDFLPVTLEDEAGSLAGTARVRNITNNKIFLFDTRFVGSNTVKDVEKIVCASGEFTVANNSVIRDSSSSPMIFDTGMISLKSTSDISIPVRASKALTGLSGTTVTISPASGEDFNLSNDDILFVDSANIKIDVLGTSLSGSDLVVSLASPVVSSATIYYNKRITNATPFTKIDTDLYVKCTFNANTDVGTSAKYNLGFPDVYEIVSITDADDNDVTTSFRLRSNQKEHYYDHSYIEFIPGRTAPADGDFTVHMKAFKINDFTGEYFFTVDSYPASFPRNKIPTYTSPAGVSYNLRDCLDFRAYVDPLSPATYVNAAVLGTAPTVSASSTGVNLPPVWPTVTYDFLTPALNQYGQLDYEFFFNRTDVVVIDSYGKVSIVKGTEEERSRPSNTLGDQIAIAEIYVPGIPALTPEESGAQNRPQYEVKINRKGTRSYRMKDIENIEKKVDTLRYYVLLSALETETKNLNIVDENGLTRFKNGIIVDPFNDLSIANINNTEFNAALDFTEKSLMPAVKTYPLNIKYHSSSSATLFPSTSNAKVGSLQRNADVAIISQPYATEFRNCVSNFYSYRGIGTLVPEYDSVYDTVTNPVNIDIDLITPLSQFADAIQEFIPLTSTSSELINSSTVIENTRRNFVTSAITDTFRNTSTFVQLTGEQSNEQRVGDFVTNFSFNPFMRSRDVNVYISGLRPNTQHYFFFDEQDVNQNVFPGSPVDDPNLIQRNGFAGDDILSDDSGVIRAVFNLPGSTFFVGDRSLEIVDVNQYSSIESGSTSYASLTYRAYNFSIEKASLTVSTRTPDSFVSEVITDRNVTRRVTQRIRGEDPIAQTFFTKSGMGLGSDTVFVSKIDLYFKKKSAINGVNVELREVVNGYPSYIVLPFSKVHLTSAEVDTSDDASVATTISFPAPVRLDVEKEYAFVVIPDGADPDYLIFTSKVGGTNLTPGENQGLPIVQDWGDGVLFTSTNATAWNSYQDEDIKFVLYRHNFNANSGSITFINDDHEFISTQNNIGGFGVGEKVYTIEDVDVSTSNTVSVVSGNNNITGTSMSTTYSSGDYILLDDGSTNKQIFQVVSANSTVVIADRPASFTDTVDAYPITVGNLVHYDFRYPNFMVLEGSSANASRKFTAADTIYGFDSDAQATIATVDNMEFSYIQPMITRATDSVTRVNLSGTFVDPNNTTNTYTKDMMFNDKTTFAKTGMVVFSKSNDIARDKALKLTVSMSNGSNTTSSPFIDIETATLLAYEWKISNTASNTSKYVSQTVQLSENLDAEDFQMYVTGYRPNGTDIKAFIKVQSASDPSVFETNDWIELELTQGINLYSSVSNLADFKEYVYTVPEGNKSSGVLTYTNDIGNYEGYRRFAIKIELYSDTVFKAPRLLDYRGIALT